MEFSELILKRRSVRAYTGELLTRAQGEIILDAGLRAPNACNFQSWHFYALIGRDAAELLYPEVYSAPWFEKIGMAVVVTTDGARLRERFGDEKGLSFAVQDIGAAMENMALAAADLGFGSCWIGAFDRDACRKKVGIPAKRTPHAILAVGRPAGETPLRDREPKEDKVTYICSEHDLNSIYSHA